MKGYGVKEWFRDHPEQGALTTKKKAPIKEKKTQVKKEELKEKPED